ncbi:MAG TPA: glutathione binding-like protein, partial [Myxococcota bacterium]|nr:glutathione binding-like protein [Myxococcota bacterium]
FFKGRIPQVPEYGAVCKEAAAKQLAWLDGVLAKTRFVAGDRFTIADITALVGIDFGRITKTSIQPGQKHLERWHEKMSARPSAKA